LITVNVADVCVIFKIKSSIMFILYTSCVFDIDMRVFLCIEVVVFEINTHARVHNVQVKNTNADIGVHVIMCSLT